MSLSEVNKSIGKESATLLGVLQKQAKIKTPLPLKIMVVAGTWITLGAIPTAMRVASERPSDSAMLVLGVLVTVPGLIAVWQLRKWGVYLLAGLAAIRIANAVAYVSDPKVLTFAIALQLLLGFFPLLYWKKMH